jgi:uncharacterized membrane protein
MNSRAKLRRLAMQTKPQNAHRTSRVVLLTLILLFCSATLDYAARRSGFTSFDFPGACRTEGVGINASGEIVGRYTREGECPFGFAHGFILRKDKITPFDFPGAANFSDVGWINSRGEIVGTYGFLPGEAFVAAYVWNGKTFTSFQYPGAQVTTGWGISPAGEIVGQALLNGTSHGYLLRHGEFTRIDYPGAAHTWATMISTGRIVGNFQDAGGIHGFVLGGGKFESIDFPGGGPTWITGINPRGDIVGYYFSGPAGPSGEENQHGFLLSNGNFESIDVPGARFTEANGINPEGDIVGRYGDSDDKVHGFLLKGEK